jgi:hypothetical protein
VDRSGTCSRFVGLHGRHNEIARSLPYGDQRRLELARALATRPKPPLTNDRRHEPQESQEIVRLSGPSAISWAPRCSSSSIICTLSWASARTSPFSTTGEDAEVPETVQRDKRVIELPRTGA